MKLSLKRIFKNLLYILGILLLGVIVMYFIPLTPSSELVELSKESQKEYSDYTKNDSLIVLVDYSYPVFMKRFWVYNLKTDKVILNTHVSHSWKSGLLFATQFSNTPGSNLSSTGVIRISEKYHGRYGPSLRLDGLDSSFDVLDPVIICNEAHRFLVAEQSSQISRNISNTKCNLILI